MMPPQIKPNWQEFKKILDYWGVTRLYHFTDFRNIQSIKKHGGLYSWQYCENNGIQIPCPGGTTWSRQLDRIYGLADYVRLNFNPNPPMLYSANHLSFVAILEVDPSVIYWTDTKFSDVNAGDNIANRGDDLEAFKKIKLAVATKEYWHEPMEFKWRQAEVMVKTHIPVSYIKIFKYGDKNNLSDEAHLPLT